MNHLSPKEFFGSVVVMVLSFLILFIISYPVDAKLTPKMEDSLQDRFEKTLLAQVLTGPCSSSKEQKKQNEFFTFTLPNLSNDCSDESLLSELGLTQEVSNETKKL